MKKISIFLSLVIAVIAASISFSTAFAAPGDPGEPIPITGCGELEAIPDGSTLHYEITQSFLCGGLFLVKDSFAGHIEGNGHTISNITIEPLGVGVIGMFRTIEASGVIQNLTFENVNITNNLATTGSVAGSLAGTLDNVHVTGTVDGQSNVGGLVGVLNGGYIVDSSADVTVTGGNDSVGGLVGDMSGSGALIEFSHASGNVQGNFQVGGLVGYARVGTAIENSYATGSSTCNLECGGFIGQGNATSLAQNYATGNVLGGDHVGGFGGNLVGSIVGNSYARGNVNGETGVGGFAGIAQSNSQFVNLYSTGIVTGDVSEGGAVGVAVSQTSSGVFYDADNSGESDTNAGSQGLSTAQMKTTSTFTNAGYNFDTVWSRDDGTNNGYPFLNQDATPMTTTTTTTTTTTSTTAPVTTATPVQEFVDVDVELPSKVVSFTDLFNSNKVSFEVGQNCLITEISQARPTDVQESQFDFAVSPTSFTAECDTPGVFMGVIIYVDIPVELTTVAVAKVSTGSGELEYIKTASSRYPTDRTGVEYIYTVQDGSSLDEDGVENAIIVDPVAVAGPNGSLGSLASTGTTVWPIVGLGVVLLLGGLAMVWSRRKPAKQ